MVLSFSAAALSCQIQPPLSRAGTTNSKFYHLCMIHGLSPKLLVLTHITVQILPASDLLTHFPRSHKSDLTDLTFSMASLGMTHVTPLLYGLDLPSWDDASSAIPMPSFPPLYLGATAAFSLENVVGIRNSRLLYRERKKAMAAL